jgi:hypothetical protein
MPVGVKRVMLALNSPLFIIAPFSEIFLHKLLSTNFIKYENLRFNILKTSCRGRPKFHYNLFMQMRNDYMKIKKKRLRNERPFSLFFCTVSVESSLACMTYLRCMLYMRILVSPMLCFIGEIYGDNKGYNDNGESSVWRSFWYSCC